MIKTRIRTAQAQIKALFMAALTAEHHPDLKRTYQEMVASGKLKKVALTSIMRKLVILLNSPLRRSIASQSRPAST